jgi:RNA-directed DNA polymerase
MPTWQKMTSKILWGFGTGREEEPQSIGKMKRFGNLYYRIFSIENLTLADQHASKGKSRQPGVIEHNKNREANILELHKLLKSGDFKTSQYKNFTIFEPKERVISKLPYYPDRIVHHAIMNVLEPIWVQVFTKDTYSCIKGRGVHSAGRNIKETFKDVAGTEYCLKIDIQKFYPNIDHDILKQIIRLPIGNYMSQYLANLYLTYFDHWIKEIMRIKYYFRYCDDIVIFYHSKVYLHQLLSDIRWYLDSKLNLTIKPSYQIFPVESRGVDFLGYVFRHDYTRLRKSIKQNFARAMAKRKSRASIAAYQGWAKHADTLHLTKKLNDDSIKKLQRFRHTGREQGHGG